MVDTLLFLLIVLPVLAGLGCFLLRSGALRKLIVLATGVVVAASAISMALQAPFAAAPEMLLGVLPVGALVMAADFLLLVVMFYYGWKHKRPAIMGLVAVQFVLLFLLEFFMVEHGTPHQTFFCDSLSTIMVLVISVVGSVICIYALPYMDTHEHHMHLEVSKQPRFFLVLVSFLGAMNGLVLTNDLGFFYFFFEVTTFCSFVLIGHDETEVATDNALRALLFNSVGGLGLLIGIMLAYSSLHTLDIQAIVRSGSLAGLTLLALGFMCFAAFVKSAQLPFQSWLLGAMVAPTPTSALLHSSTMVKAGVYFALRLAPAYAGTFLSTAVGLVGAFTFLAASALAIGQSNGKKVLAYSTVANLGLIFACAGINTPAAITAGIMLIMFHAASKGLLFLCVGTIEQNIDSRDIEDMRGLYEKMPVTALITVMGVLTMILPPFGMLLGKWMAIESAAGSIFLTVMLALGSALTVLYWARWAGGLMASTFHGEFQAEKQGFLTRYPLVFLCAAAGALSLFAPVIYGRMVVPALSLYGNIPFDIAAGGIDSPTGAFLVYPLFIVVAVGLFVALRNIRKMGVTRITGPYLSGIQRADEGVYTGPMNQPVVYESGNYYLNKLFGEQCITPWANFVGGLLLLLLIGGAF